MNMQGSGSRDVSSQKALVELHGQSHIILLMRRKRMVMEQSHICASFQGKIHYSFVMGKSRVRPLKNAVTLS